MAYIAQSDLKGLIPAEFIIEALDDNRDGIADADAWAEVVAEVQEAIDGPLSTRFPTPFAEPLPKIIKRCARLFAVERLFSRRGAAPDKNLSDQISGAHALLRAIARGEAGLAADVKPIASHGGAAITEPSKTHLTGGGLLS